LHDTIVQTQDQVDIYRSLLRDIQYTTHELNIEVTEVNLIYYRSTSFLSELNLLYDSILEIEDQLRDLILSWEDPTWH
jgi:hypothetical protein